MTIKVYGESVFTTCTQRILTVLHEKGLPYEIIPIDLIAGEHKKPAYLALQPFGQIPVLEDDGFFVYESRAIARYIALKYVDQGTPLIPPMSDVKAFALLEQAISIEQSNFDLPISGYTREKLYKPVFYKLPTDEERAAECLKTLTSNLSVYDGILSKQKYLAGDSFTLADIFHLPYGHVLTNTFKLDLLTSSEFPNVARWWGDITTRASWQAVKPN